MRLTLRTMAHALLIASVSCGDDSERNPVEPEEPATPVSAMNEYAEAFVSGDKEAIARLLHPDFTYDVYGMCPSGSCREVYPTNYVQELGILGHMMDSADPGPGPAVAEREMTASVMTAETLANRDMRCMVQLVVRVRTAESLWLLSNAELEITFRRGSKGAFQILEMLEYTLGRSPSGCWAETRCSWS